MRTNHVILVVYSRPEFLLSLLEGHSLTSCCGLLMSVRHRHQVPKNRHFPPFLERPYILVDDNTQVLISSAGGCKHTVAYLLKWQFAIYSLSLAARPPIHLTGWFPLLVISRCFVVIGGYMPNFGIGRLYCDTSTWHRQWSTVRCDRQFCVLAYRVAKAVACR